MRFLKKRQTVFDRAPVLGIGKMYRRHGVVKDKAGTADQMPGGGVVNAAVVAKVMKKTAVLGVDTTRVVKTHRSANMIG